MGRYRGRSDLNAGPSGMPCRVCIVPFGLECGDVPWRKQVGLAGHPRSHLRDSAVRQLVSKFVRAAGKRRRADDSTQDHRLRLLTWRGGGSAGGSRRGSVRTQLGDF
eukprot:scaffold325300_cov66-Tisochrysis_lutea.AAC.2